MAGIQKANWESKVDACAADNGALACRWFGFTPEALEAKVGRFTKGKNKGKLRGWVVWRRVTEGGWQFGPRGERGGVVRPGMIWAEFCATYDEMCEAGNRTNGEFLIAAQRVDTAYGYSRAAEKAVCDA